MLRWLPILWANLSRRKLRLAFTFVSILLAFLMFGMLDALRTSLAGVVNVVGADRVLVQSKISMVMPLPRAHYEKIRALPGVKAAASFNWFGGMYKDAKRPSGEPRIGNRMTSAPARLGICGFKPGLRQAAQKDSAPAQWYRARAADARGATRKRMIVALAPILFTLID